MAVHSRRPRARAHRQPKCPQASATFKSKSSVAAAGAVARVAAAAAVCIAYSSSSPSFSTPAGRCAAFSVPHQHSPLAASETRRRHPANNARMGYHRPLAVGSSSFPLSPSYPSGPRISGSNANSKSIVSTSALGALPNVEDLVYAAQSSASDLAASTMSGLNGGGGGSTGGGSLVVLYAAGLLTSFSPCSLGLLPLTVSYISSAAGERDDRAALLPTVAFAAGLASVFCGLGLSASLLGGVFGSSGGGGGAGEGGNSLLGTILLASLSSGVSIAMGLQLLELIRIPLPSLELAVPSFGDSNKNDDTVDRNASEISLYEDGNLIPATSAATSASASTSNVNNGATKSTTTNIPSTSTAGAASLFRTFLLGGSSALVASPCATPVLTSILAFLATNRDTNPTLGAALLFTYTLGYSTPLLVVGATGGQALANAQAAAADAAEDGGSVVATIGRLVTPLTAAVLIWYGTTGFLEAVFGDPSLMGLAPVLE